MCGISGFAGSLYSKAELQKLMNDASNRLQHRGPDQKACYIGKEIALGISRLAIRDPVHGIQPMSLGSYTIIFNGELYNTGPLKQKLKSAGYSFQTECDTEILLSALIEFGDAIIPELEGMFAFALWNEKNQSLTLARDRWGEKPLYYAYAEKSLTFGSEIKALHCFPHLKWNVSEEDIAIFLKNSYLPHPRTGWHGIHKLKPGTVLHFQNGEVKTRSFFTPTLHESALQSLKSKR
jgi:asparagine synthase (glutamine-hydrolysing)